MPWPLEQASDLRARLGSAPVAISALGALVAAAVVLAAAGSAMDSTLVLVVYGGAFVPYLLACAGARDAAVSPWWFVAAAAGARLALVPADPLLSDDIYRYVWDGRVTAAGINPFRYAPAADALAGLRDPWIWTNINHPEVPTIYPPGAQYLFAANAWMSGGVVGIKLLFLAIEAGCIVVCWGLLRGRVDRSLLVSAFAVYALNPLVFVEVAWSGHLDAVAWSLLVVGLILWRTGEFRGSAALSGASIGLSASVKFLGLVAWPFLIFDRGTTATGARPLRRRLLGAAAAAGVLVASYLPVAGAGSKLFAGFGTYAESWRGNDGIYRALHGIGTDALESWAPDGARASGEVLYRFDELDGLYRRLGWTKRWRGRTLPDTTYTAGRLASIAAKAAAAVVLALVALYCLILGRRPLESTALLILVLYLFAPVLHPWYVAWLVPFAALRGRWTGILFSFTVLAGYLAWSSAQTGGPWHVPTWAVTVEYGVVLAAFWLESARTKPEAGLLPTLE